MRIAPLIACVLFSVTAHAADADPFAALGVEGAFVLRDLGSGATTVVGGPRADERHIPMSTFKIPSTLIGLETGVIAGERFTLKWDGTPYRRTSWERDHDLASAIKHSVVWYYQAVARRVGEARMKALVTAFAYGNQDLSGGIDRFWLDDGGLRISAREQVDFLARLTARKLPVKPAHVALLERIIVLEDAGGVVWRGKTGTGLEGDRAIGWLVGTVERGGRTWAYATLVLAPRARLEYVQKIRHDLTRTLLRRAGVLPAS